MVVQYYFKATSKMPCRLEARYIPESPVPGYLQWNYVRAQLPEAGTLGYEPESEPEEDPKHRKSVTRAVNSVPSVEC